MLGVNDKTDYAPLAKSYAAHRHTHPQVLARLTADLSPASRVLELGCGTGNYLQAVRAAVGCGCVGIDPSPEMLAQLRARGSDVQTLQTSAERLDLPDQSFDLVYSVDVIHHIRDRDAAFREAFRVLRDGGRIATATDSEWTIKNRDPLARYFPETVDIELARYPRLAQVCAELTNAGFGEIREELVEHAYELTDATAFRQKVFSSLLYMSEEAFQKGLLRLEADLTQGPIRCVSRYAFIWAVKPSTPIG